MKKTKHHKLFGIFCLYAGACLSVNVPKTYAQTPQDLLSALQAQTEHLAGMHKSWMVAQTSYNSEAVRTNLSKGAAKEVETLDKFSPQYTNERKNVEAITQTFKEIPETHKEEIKVDLYMVSPTKWRVVFRPMQVSPEMATQYVADGTGKVFIVYGGQGRIEVGTKPDTILADVLRGDVNILLSSVIKNLSPEQVHITSSGGIKRLNFNNEISGTKIELSIDSATLIPTGFVESTESKQVLCKIVQASTGAAEYELLYPDTGSPLQHQTWIPQKLEELSAAKEVTPSYFTYKFVPGYMVTVLMPNGLTQSFASDEMVGKELHLD